MKLDDIDPRARAAREAGRECVVVLGLGFVGTAVAANLSRSVGTDGQPLFFVIGLDLDEERAARLDVGRAPTYANDPSLEEVIAAACNETGNLVGTTDQAALAHADVVVSCINLDLQREPGQTEELGCKTEGYAAAMRSIGRHVRPGTLVTVESTLPVGLCDTVLYPALCQGQREQGVDTEAHPPLLAYCYERVMPGPNYLDSVNEFWRAYAGIDEESGDRAAAFLSKYVNVEKYPLWRHKTTRAGEMAKLLENSYRATNIAFIEEWSMLAEDAGVDLFDVIASVKKRAGTHDNMMLPGLGVGGYCLTKDALLAAYGAEHLLKAPAALPFSRRAILTNERMPVRAVEHVERHFEGDLVGKRAVLFGVTYRPGVVFNDTATTEIVARALLERGADVVAYDPLVDVWEELPELQTFSDPREAVEGADVVVVCLPDGHYREFLAQLLLETMKPGSIVIDPWNMVAEACDATFAERGVALEVYGRGDVGGPVRRRNGAS
jgi:nucleotide sugar dehydrogenase